MSQGDYAMQLYQGPIMTGPRPMALGGAFAGIAEGVEGTPLNAASPAVRAPHIRDWVDYDLGAGVAFPGAFTATDFDNRGSSSSSRPPGRARQASRSKSVAGMPSAPTASLVISWWWARGCGL